MEKQKTTINGILDLAGISDYDKQQISDRAKKILSEYSRDLLTGFAKYTYNRIKINTGGKYSVFNIETFALDYFNDILHQSFEENIINAIDKLIESHTPIFDDPRLFFSPQVKRILLEEIKKQFDKIPKDFIGYDTNSKVSVIKYKGFRVVSSEDLANDEIFVR